MAITFDYNFQPNTLIKASEVMANFNKIGALIPQEEQIVTLTATQTLINKTLTSPTINGGTISNATLSGTTNVTGAFNASTINSFYVYTGTTAVYTSTSTSINFTVKKPVQILFRSTSTTSMLYGIFMGTTYRVSGNYWNNIGSDYYSHSFLSPGNYRLTQSSGATMYVYIVGFYGGTTFNPASCSDIIQFT